MAAVDTTLETAHGGLIAPHGGTLVDLMVPESDRQVVRASADRRVECSHRNACDVELLVVGGFSPLRGFMHQEDYDAVVAGNRTSSGLLFGLPIVFDSDDDTIAIGERLLLTYGGQELAVFTVESKWEPDKAREAQGCYGTTSIEHPAVRMITGERGRFYLGGSVQDPGRGALHPAGRRERGGLPVPQPDPPGPLRTVHPRPPRRQRE
jgi:sulfate adenylyltransferase